MYEKFTSTEFEKQINLPLELEVEKKPIEKKHHEKKQKKIAPFHDKKLTNNNLDSLDINLDIDINDVLNDSIDETVIKYNKLKLEPKEIKYKKPENETEMKKALNKIDKDKMKNDQSCGPGLDPRNKNKNLFCEGNAVNNWKLNKPVSEVLNKITKCSPENAPKAVKDIYNKIVNPPKRHLDNVEIQGSYTMNNNNNKWLNLKVESKKPTKLTDSLFANDPDFDTFSRF
tara:strand:- start:104 stop:790 length:687 start_codon:yes stop_codon:yes gene_type:complete